MLKTLEQLTHEENLMLLEYVAKGEINEKDVNGNVFFATEYQDYFLGLQVAGNQVNDEKITVFCLGESRIAKEYMDKIGSIELVGPGMEVTGIIKLTKDNYL